MTSRNQSWENIWRNSERPGFLHNAGGYLARFGDLQRIVMDEIRATGSLGHSPAILEVGCGTSPVMKMLSRHTDRRYGVDISPAAASASSLHCNAAVADGMKLPFADDTFDLVYSTGVLDLFPDGEAGIFLREMARVLRRGGKAVVITSWSGCRLHRAVMEHLTERNRWRYGGKRSFETLKHLLPPEFRLVTEKGRGALYQLRFVSYLFEQNAFLRRTYNGFFLAVSILLYPLNRFPGAVLVTCVERK